MLDWPGLSYLRVLRGETTVLTPLETAVRIGGSREIGASSDDRLAIVASGVTVGEAVEAMELLRADGIKARVVDAYSIKPLDAETVASALAAVDGRVVVVEDHRPEGGLGSAVAEAMAERGATIRMRHLAVREMPGSAEPAQQRAAAGIDAHAIREAALELVA
jgi:transketolase